MTTPRLVARWLVDEHPETVALVEESLAFRSVTDASRRLILTTDGAGGADDRAVPFRLRHGFPETLDGDLADAPFLLAVRVFAADEDRDEFRRWLDEEHCARQVGIPGVRWYLGYEEDGPEHSFLNLWGLDDPTIADGAAWVQARDTEWWARLAHVPASADRDVYRRDEAI